jgi:hypothetical protein
MATFQEKHTFSLSTTLYGELKFATWDVNVSCHGLFGPIIIQQLAQSHRPCLIHLCP